MLKLLLVSLIFFVFCSAIETEDDNLFEGRRLSWEEEDGLKIEIIKPIKKADCKLKSRPGDVVDQYYELKDKDGNLIGSNFGKEPYRFTLGRNQVIAGMDKVGNLINKSNFNLRL
jgi:hypothetical protein